jgi:hypothetical protein
MSDGVSVEHCGEASPAVGHGFWAWRFIIAVPAAEAGGYPGEPGEGAAQVRILLFGGLSLERPADGVGGLDQAFVDDVGGGTGAGAAGVGELEDARRRDKAEGGEIEQAALSLD